MFIGVNNYTNNRQVSGVAQDMEFVVYPDKVADSSMERLLDVLFNSDVMIYVADAESVNSTDKVYLYYYCY